MNSAILFLSGFFRTILLTAQRKGGVIISQQHMFAAGTKTLNYGITRGSQF